MKRTLASQGHVFLLKYQVSKLLKNNEKDTLLEEAGVAFVNEAVHFKSRDDFNDYMHSLEARYYDSVNLPKSPYQVSVPNFGGKMT